MARFFQPKKKTKLETKHQEIKIDRLDHHGAGLAYWNKKPVFVDGALPDEQVLIQLTESKSKYARGKLIRVLKASEQRVKPFCSHFEQCGGCNMQHLDMTAQREFKQQTLSQLMSKFANQDLSLEAPILSESKGYRRRARVSLHIDKKTRKLQFGFRKSQSKEIVNVTDCPVLDPTLNLLLPELYDLFRSFRSPEDLGHVELVKGMEGAVIVLRHVKPLADDNLAALHDLAKKHQATLYLMPQTDQLDLVIGNKPHYAEAGVTIPFAPNNFIQVNQSVNEKMVAQALEWLDITEQDRVLDLFCGLGNFSLPIAKRAKSVIGIEGVDEMVNSARDNAGLNHIDNAQFYQANLEEDMTSQPWATEQFDKILLDPARAGASGIVDQFSQFGVKRVVYVSCNPATLARDTQSLIEQGYQLEKLGMLDMFPNTSHLESMALFVKV